MNTIERLHTLGGETTILNLQRHYDWKRKCLVWRMLDPNEDLIQADTLEALLDAYEQAEKENENT